MKNPRVLTKHLIGPALVPTILRFITLIALLSCPWSQPASSVLANRETSLDLERHTGLHTTGSLPSSSLSKLDQTRVSQNYAKMPLYFIENRGQVDSRVAYYVQGRDKSMYFTPDGITFVLTGKADRTDLHAEQQHALKLDFIGARPGVRPNGQDLTSATISYFKGTRDQWKTGLRTFSTLVYPDLWPGVDLIYAGTVNQMKYTFSVRPGADPNQIKLAYRGASEVKLTDDGQLEVMTPVGGFHDEKPYSYQDVDGKRVEIGTAYALNERSITGAQGYTFHLADYDKTRPLVIDPAVRIYTGFIGGAGDDEGRGIAVDGSGNAYVVGTTSSSDLPTGTATSPGRTFRCFSSFGCTNAFVVKVRANGTGLVYAGYIGGSGTNEGRGIAVDDQGRAYLTGMTTSIGFPAVNLPRPPIIQGNAAFAVRVAADGNSLEYSGVIDGANDEEGNGIAVDASGNAYLVGTTNSRISEGFPANVGPDLNASCPGDCPRRNDAFVAKINANGTSLGYCRYIGGVSHDIGKAIAVDSQGRAYVTGTTDSNERLPNDQFPVRIGPDRTFNGSNDAFIARVTANGIFLEYCGYIGGSHIDEGNSIAVDADGNAYVTGTTSSTNLPDGDSIGRRFPSPNPFVNSGTDAFVVKVNPSGSGFVYAGYIGGFGNDEGRGIALDPDKNAYITGFTESPAGSFPDGNGIGTLPGPDQVLTGLRDAFIVRVEPDGTAFNLATYIGGTGDEDGNGIAVDGDKNVYVTGRTNSPRLDSIRFPVPASPDPSFNGGESDAFVEKISAVPDPPFMCPGNITVTAEPGKTCAPVNYPVPQGSILIFATHPSGSLFPIGDPTTVTIFVNTASGIVQCIFTVTVNPSP